ncbi:unnamed protein product, partial [marine sediment metagenome]
DSWQDSPSETELLDVDELYEHDLREALIRSLFYS